MTKSEDSDGPPDAPAPEPEEAGAPSARGDAPAAAGSPVTGGSTASARDAAADNDDQLQPGGRDSWVIPHLQAQAAFVGGTTNIGSVFIGDGKQHVPVPLTDLAALHADAPFVAPPGYAELVTALHERRVVVCQGPNGCGKELAVSRALRDAGEKVVKLLPASLSLAQVRQVIEVAGAEGGAYVIPGLDETALRGLAGTAGQSVRALAFTGRVKVVVITAAEGAADRQGFALARLGYPDTTAVLDAYCDKRAASAESRQLAAEAITLLDAPVSPAVVMAVLHQAAANPAQRPQDIAGAFSDALTVNAVHAWVADERKPRELAVLAVGASLPGVSAIRAQEQVLGLLWALTGGRREEVTVSESLRAIDWPAGLLQSATYRQNTHFGVQSLEVVDAVAPHQPYGIIQAAWRAPALGPGFHQAYCRWLSGLAADRKLRWQAAYTAGALFAVDASTIQDLVLQPWLRDRNPAAQSCAGLALGTPIAIGADPASARKLANAWATNGSPEQRRAAIAAYGGLLGAWDTASAAPLKLFLIAQLDPDPMLRLEARLALARLVVQGAEAVAARSTVIAYLTVAIENRSTRHGAFDCLPWIARQLSQTHPVCVSSLAALRDEKENWSGLMRLFAAAFMSAAGQEAGRACLEYLVRAAARDSLDLDVVECVIRDMRTQRRPLGDGPRLRDAVRRALLPLSRSDNDHVRDVAKSLIHTFFG